MPKPIRMHVPWLEDKVADLWPERDTAAIAKRLVVTEAHVANALARMRDRSDPRLRSVAR